MSEADEALMLSSITQFEKEQLRPVPVHAPSWQRKYDREYREMPEGGYFRISTLRRTSQLRYK